jgi:hypothetical protein
LGTGRGAEVTNLSGGGENGLELVPSDVGGVLGADWVMTHSKESIRLWETETCDNLSYRSSLAPVTLGVVGGVAVHCAFSFEIGEPSAGLNAEGIEGLNENNGRQDIVVKNAIASQATCQNALEFFSRATNPAAV